MTAPVRDQIQQLIRTAMDESPSADPAVVAKVVLDGLSAKQARAALAITLPEYVRQQMARYGWRTRAAAKQPMTSADRVRHWYSQMLGAPLFVGDQWKFLRDCSADDLHTAAADRYKKATQVHAEGDRWTKLALFMEEHDRETVAEVTEEELKSLMEES